MDVKMNVRCTENLFLVFIGILKLASSFNIDIDYPVVKQGKSGTYFGFAVAQHQITISGKVENWLLISAPKSNTSAKSNFQETGAVFKCSSANSTKLCKDEVIFDTRRGSTTENKNGQWFGVSLKSGGIDQSVLACAHRYMSYGPGNNYNLLEGICRSMESDLKSTGYSFNPCRDKVSGVKVPSYENYGQCQTGIGIDIIKKAPLEEFLFGSVGVENFQGRTFKRASDISDGLIESDKIDGMELSYFGYSVAHGNYLSTTRKDVATGGPRSDSTGKVVILKREASKMSWLLTLPAVEDKVQLASAFGFAVCAYNIANKPGYTHLLVGAPFHQNGEAEEGMVYIYLRSGEKSMKLVQKLTVTNPRANFGAAIISAGDLDLDGYNDLVVGAPYEENFAGAVYIFHGTAKGLSSVYSQRIAAAKVDAKLRAFGRSLAGGMDMDSNGYSDVLVGAYLSDQAALLRSRPVVKIIASIKTNPSKINPDDYMTTENQFRIIVSYRYEEKSKRLSSNIKAKLKLTIDPGRTARIKFPTEDTNVVTAVVSVGANDRIRPFTAYLVRDKKGKFQSFPDVKMELTFSLMLDDLALMPGIVPSLDSRPVLESHKLYGQLENFHKFDSSLIKFTRDCDPCIPDLSITTNKTLIVRLGKVNVKFGATIVNKANGTAFQTDLGLVLPKGISVSLITLSNGELKTCEDASPHAGGKTRTVCKNLFTEIKPKATEKIVVVLDTKKLDANIDDTLLTLNITSANMEAGTITDNVFTVNLTVVAEADLKLSGNAITKREFYGGKVIGESALKRDSEVGHVLKHRYYVINSGPDLIPNAVVTIDWPIETVSGKHLLYLMDIQSPANCTFLSGELNELHLKSSTSLSSNVNKSAAGSLISSERRRRDVPNSLPPTSTSNTTSAVTKVPAGNSNQGKKNVGTRMGGRVLDCLANTAKCAKLVCKTNELPVGKGIPIEIISRIWNSTLLMDYKGETVSVVSRASVAIGSNASYISDPNILNNKASIFSILHPETPKTVKERVAVWKIVLAVLAGIILLALLIFGLYKLGFFKRTDKSSWNKNRKSAPKENDDLLDKKDSLNEKE